jgi:hypothetical protein
VDVSVGRHGSQRLHLVLFSDCKVDKWMATKEEETSISHQVTNMYSTSLRLTTCVDGGNLILEPIKVSNSAYLPALRLGRWPEFDFGSLGGTADKCRVDQVFAAESATAVSRHVPQTNGGDSIGSINQQLRAAARVSSVRHGIP